MFVCSFDESQDTEYDISRESLVQSHILRFNGAAMNLVQHFHLQCKYSPVIVHQASVSKCLLLPSASINISSREQVSLMRQHIFILLVISHCAGIRTNAPSIKYTAL